MDHIAIDLGGRKSFVCRRNARGEIQEEKFVETRRVGAFLRRHAPSRVVLETSAESFHIADQCRSAGHEVVVVPATMVRSLGVGSGGKKTDQRDARCLSDVSSKVALTGVHIPSHESRRLKSQCAAREALVQTRTLLINNIRGYLRTMGVRLRSGATESFCKRVREKAPVLTPHVERSLNVIATLNQEIKAADKELMAECKADELRRRLMTVPGVGPVTATRFKATIDEVGRFDNAHDLQSYIGLVPGERSSSERKHRTSITKTGAPALRWALVQAAWSARRSRARHPMVLWANEVVARRGKMVATVALARKIAGILYALWRDGTVYCPVLASSACLEAGAEARRQQRATARPRQQ